MTGWLKCGRRVHVTETLPVEAKPVWHKQAIGLEEDEEEEEEVRASEEPT